MVSTSPENLSALSLRVPEILKGEFCLQKWRKFELKTFPTCKKVKISFYPQDPLWSLLNKQINQSTAGRTYLCLYHGWSLGEKHLDRLEHVDDTFVPHPLQDDTQRHEDARTTDTSTAPPTNINLINLNSVLNAISTQQPKFITTLWYNLVVQPCGR